MTAAVTVDAGSTGIQGAALRLLVSTYRSERNHRRALWPTEVPSSMTVAQRALDRASLWEKVAGQAARMVATAASWRLPIDEAEVAAFALADGRCRHWMMRYSDLSRAERSAATSLLAVAS